MVGSISNRIAAFESMAEKSKSSSKLMSIKPPEAGFAASKNRSAVYGKVAFGKEILGYSSPPPAKKELKKPERRGEEFSEKGHTKKSATLTKRVQEEVPIIKKEKSQVPDENKETEDDSIQEQKGPVAEIEDHARSDVISPLSFQGRKISSQDSVSEYSADSFTYQYSRRFPMIDENHPYDDEDTLVKKDIEELEQNEDLDQQLSIESESRDTLGSELSLSQKSAFAFARAPSEKSCNDESRDSGISSENEEEGDPNDDQPSIENAEEYDNFTFGSEDSNENIGVDGDDSDKSERNKEGMTYKPFTRTKTRSMSKSEKKAMDPNFLDDISDSGSSRSSSKASKASTKKSNDGSNSSFDDYIQNLVPVPSFNGKDEQKEENLEVIDSPESSKMQSQANINAKESDEKKIPSSLIERTTSEEHFSSDEEEDGDDYPTIAPKDKERTALPRESEILKEMSTQDFLNIDAQNSLIFPEPNDNKNMITSNEAQSPACYPEGDCEENDEDGSFEEDEFEMDDDETGDLLGINFEELSMQSDAIESNFVNPTSNNNITQYPDLLSEPIESIPQQGLLASKERKNYEALGAIDEEEVIESPKQASHLYTYATSGSSGPPLTIHNNHVGLSKSHSDDVSQITESTYYAEKHTNRRTSLDNNDHSSQRSESSSSFVTYSITEESRANSIVQKAEPMPIFRDRHSMSEKSIGLGINNSISDLTDSNTPARFPRRQNVPGTSNRTLSTKPSGISTKPSSNSISSGQKRESVGRNANKTSQKSLSSDRNHGKQKDKVSTRRGRPDKREKNEKGFSLRSLSPFRRGPKVDKNLRTAQEEFRQQREELKRRNLTRQGSARSMGSTPSEIIEQDNRFESRIPLVAVTSSDDSSELRKGKPKKKFSLRSLSPFHRRSSRGRSKSQNKRRSKKGKEDPFDENPSL